jgi:hypothetical protein
VSGVQPISPSGLIPLEGAFRCAGEGEEEKRGSRNKPGPLLRGRMAAR